jgi:hypothetical protein
MVPLRVPRMMSEAARRTEAQPQTAGQDIRPPLRFDSGREISTREAEVMLTMRGGPDDRPMMMMLMTMMITMMMVVMVMMKVMMKCPMP